MESNRLIRWSEIEPYCVLRMILRNFWMVLCAAVIGAVSVNLVLTNIYPERYSSTTTFAVTSKYATVFASTDMRTAEEVTELFSQLIQSDLLKERVCTDLGTESLPGSIEVETTEGTNLLRLTATADSPKMALRLLQSVIKTYPDIADYIQASAILTTVNGISVSPTPSNGIPMNSACRTGALVGAILMILWLIWFSVTSETIQTVASARRHIDARLLSTIRHETKNRTLRTKLRRTNRALLLNAPTISFSFAETFHRITAKLEHQKHKNNNSIILVGSVAENEGKSTVAANLALSLAQRHKKVLLIDCDLRKPAQYRIFDIPKQEVKELSELLQHELSAQAVQEHLTYLEQHNLFCLFSTRYRSDSTELLGTSSLPELLTLLKPIMDYIIIDTPPLGLFPDTQLIAGMADESLLVVRQDIIPYAHINDAADVLRNADSDFLGCVINDLHQLLPTASGYAGYYGRSSHSAVKTEG